MYILDIKSPDFATAAYELLQKAKEDMGLRKRLLSEPKQVLFELGFDLSDYQVLIEDHPGYDLYFEVRHPTIGDKGQDSSPYNEQDSFMDQHFMDCHNV